MDDGRLRAAVPRTAGLSPGSGAARSFPQETLASGDLIPGTQQHVARNARMAVGARWATGTGGGAHLEVAIVEVVAGEAADVGVHAVLDTEHLDRPARLHQALEQGAVEREVAALLAEDRRRQLLRVAHEHHPARHTRARTAGDSQRHARLIARGADVSRRRAAVRLRASGQAHNRS